MALRSRRLLAELSGGGVSGSGGGGGGWQVDAAALAALGPDVLTERVKVVTAALGRWAAAPAEEWQAALRQLAALLSTGGAWRTGLGPSRMFGRFGGSRGVEDRARSRRHLQSPIAEAAGAEMPLAASQTPPSLPRRRQLPAR